MRAKSRKLLLLITALGEGAVGLCFLFQPIVPLDILLGLEHATVGRIAGVALLAIGIASWMARNDALTPAPLGLLTAILFYHAAIAILLAFAGAVLNMIGVLLWPTVIVHAILAVWSFSCVRPNSIARYSRREAVDRRTPKD
jgi:hypothetical protein